jgi:hypothetical protein
VTFAAFMHFDDYVRVVEEAFGLYGEGKTLKPGMMHIYTTDGELHINAEIWGCSLPQISPREKYSGRAGGHTLPPPVRTKVVSVRHSKNEAMLEPMPKTLPEAR